MVWLAAARVTIELRCEECLGSLEDLRSTHGGPEAAQALPRSRQAVSNATWVAALTSRRRSVRSAWACRSGCGSASR